MNISTRKGRWAAAIGALLVASSVVVVSASQSASAACACAASAAAASALAAAAVASSVFRPSRFACMASMPDCKAAISGWFGSQGLDLLAHFFTTLP